VQAGRDYASGASGIIPINPVWDNLLLDLLEKGELAQFDQWTVEWMGEQGGGSGHEVRTWIAAFASLATSGAYTMSQRFYRPIPEWIAGFAVATAR
jgi:2,3-dihydroxyphenylpropionate 1,2-dioxygenase